MTLSANKLTQLEKLIEKMLDEELTHDEGRTLNRILIDSQDARTYYRRYINIHYGLIARYGKGMRAEAPSTKTISIEAPKPEDSDFEPGDASDGPTPLSEVKRRAAMAVPPAKSKSRNEAAKVKPKVIDELDVLAEAADHDETPTPKRRHQSSSYAEPQIQEFQRPRQAAQSGVRWEFIIFAFAILVLAGVVIFINTQNNTPGPVVTDPSIVATPSVQSVPAQNVPEKPVIKLTQPSGTIQLIRHDQRMQVSGEMNLNIDDQIQTSSDSSLIVQIPATSTALSLQSNTHIEFQGADAIKVIQGNVHIMDDSLSSSMPFKVYTSKAIIEPIGTQFEVEVVNNATRVNVTKGSVKMVRLEDMKAVVVAENQYALLKLDTAFEARSMDQKDVDANQKVQITMHPVTPIEVKQGPNVVGTPKSNISDLAYTNKAQQPVPVKVLPEKKPGKKKAQAPKPTTKPQLPDAVVIDNSKPSEPVADLQLPDPKQALVWHPFKTVREDQFWDDQSNSEIKLNFRAVDSTGVNQDKDHLSLLIETHLKSTSYTNVIAENVKKSQAFSLSMWVNPANEIISKVRMPKTKPSYIISIAEDMKNRNFTFTQIGPVYGIRFRCSTTNNNGMTDMRDAWLLETSPVVKNEWQHVAFTYGADQTLRIFVDGAKAAERKLGGDLNNWSERQLLIIGNEADERKNRGWIGKIANLQIYDRKLSSKEISSIHTASKPQD